MYRIMATLLVVFISAVAHAATLEIPAPHTTLSGIGVISGWKCETTGPLTVRFDGGDAIPLLYGSERGDTLSVCGDKNNGFVAIMNWGNLGDGEHTAVAYDNGVEFGRTTFYVITTGEDFLRDAQGSCSIPNFPSPGETATFTWTEATQHLEMTKLEGPGARPSPEGEYACAPSETSPGRLYCTRRADGTDSWTCAELGNERFSCFANGELSPGFHDDPWTCEGTLAACTESYDTTIAQEHTKNRAEHAAALKACEERQRRNTAIVTDDFGAKALVTLEDACVSFRDDLHPNFTRGIYSGRRGDCGSCRARGALLLAFTPLSNCARPERAPFCNDGHGFFLDEHLVTDRWTVRVRPADNLGVPYDRSAETFTRLFALEQNGVLYFQSEAVDDGLSPYGGDSYYRDFFVDGGFTEDGYGGKLETRPGLSFLVRPGHVLHRPPPPGTPYGAAKPYCCPWDICSDSSCGTYEEFITYPHTRLFAISPYAPGFPQTNPNKPPIDLTKPLTLRFSGEYWNVEISLPQLEQD